MAQDTAVGGNQGTVMAGTPATTSPTPSVQASGKGSWQGVVEGEEELQEGMGTDRRRVPAPPSTLVVMEACPGPPLWTAPSQSSPPVRRPPRIPLGTVPATTAFPLVTASPTAANPSEVELQQLKHGRVWNAVQPAEREECVK